MTVGPAHILALRITKGRLSRRGVYHAWQPCIFLLVHGRRRPR